MTRLPRLPRREPVVTEHQRDTGTMMALFAVLAISAGFLGLTAMVFPQLVVVVALMAGAGLFFVLHYVTWGRYLNRMREEQGIEEPPLPVPPVTSVLPPELSEEEEEDGGEEETEE